MRKPPKSSALIAQIYHPLSDLPQNLQNHKSNGSEQMRDLLHIEGFVAHQDDWDHVSKAIDSQIEKLDGVWILAGILPMAQSA